MPITSVNPPRKQTGYFEKPLPDINPARDNYCTEHVPVSLQRRRCRNGQSVPRAASNSWNIPATFSVSVYPGGAATTYSHMDRRERPSI